MIVQRRITIVQIRKPMDSNVNHQLQWLGSSLGLFSLRDKDKSCFRIFIELVKASKKGIPISSDEISDRSNLTRGTVVHHLNKLMDAGMVMRQRNGYILRDSELSSLVEQIEHDCLRMCESLKGIAKDIDKSLS
ncbi:ArsR family transcriptional regulator [Candidatus Woesearchaeota archaeon]|nr:ArsR family transcriptional regulator [Candidatus Woesearchaeota archaeon]